MSDHRETGSEGWVDPKLSVDDLLRQALLRDGSLPSVDGEDDHEDPARADDLFADESALSSEELLAADLGRATSAEKRRMGWEDREVSEETYPSDATLSVLGVEADADSHGHHLRAEEPARWISLASSMAAAVLMISAAILGIVTDPTGPTEESVVASLRRGELAYADAWLIARPGFEANVSDAFSTVGDSDGRRSDLLLWTPGDSATRSASESLSPIRILTPRVRSLASTPSIRVATRGLADGIALSAVIEDLDGRVWLDVDLSQGFATWPMSAEALEPGRSYRLTVSGPTSHSPWSKTVFAVAAPGMSRMMDAMRRRQAREIKDPSLRAFAWARFLARSGFQGEALASLSSLVSISEPADGPSGVKESALIAFLRLRAATDLAHDLRVWGHRSDRR